MWPSSSAYVAKIQCDKRMMWSGSVAATVARDFIIDALDSITHITHILAWIHSSLRIMGLAPLEIEHRKLVMSIVLYHTLLQVVQQLQPQTHLSVRHKWGGLQKHGQNKTIKTKARC